MLNVKKHIVALLSNFPKVMVFSYLGYFIITYNSNGSVEHWNSTNSQVKLTALYSEYYPFICMLSQLKRI